jgi:hypothetical protein
MRGQSNRAKFERILLTANMRQCSFAVSWDSSVGIAVGYGTDGQRSIPLKVKIFLFFTASRQALGPNQPPLQWVPGALLPGIKRPVCEANHSPPSIAEIKSGGVYLHFPMPSYYSA